MRFVKIDLLKYANMNICVALSGGRDSMALLHFLLKRGGEYGISVCALNLDHRMRGESSSRDSVFVAGYCKKQGVPLLFFEWTEEGAKTEETARLWRREKYSEAVLPRLLEDGREWKGADAVATAHHMGDNAETVLFNLARGSGLSGLTGIKDEEIKGVGKPFKLIRPFSEVSRAEIDGYVKENGIPYVDDETNFTDDYTRNKIRRNVLPALKSAVHGAEKAIYRFSRIAAEDEEYFENLIKNSHLITKTPFGYEISRCEEKSVFKRAVLKVFSECGIRDYTGARLNTLYDLQFSGNGKKFHSADCTAYCEEGKIAICIGKSAQSEENEADFESYFKEGRTSFCGMPLYFGAEEDIKSEKFDFPFKTLRFDLDKIPQGAVVRFMRAGDRFEKFGGGSKNLGSFFTDRKIPVRERAKIPVIAKGKEIYVVCGVEISAKVKLDGDARHRAVCLFKDVTEG